jgi:hypothetical protein
MSWKLQKINTGGNTTGPAAVQVPFVSDKSPERSATLGPQPIVGDGDDWRTAAATNRCRRCSYAKGTAPFGVA